MSSAHSVTNMTRLRLKLEAPSSRAAHGPTVFLSPSQLTVHDITTPSSPDTLGAQEIMVTSEESQNFYHFHDNRVLPSHVDESIATKEGVLTEHLIAVLAGGV